MIKIIHYQSSKEKTNFNKNLIDRLIKKRKHTFIIFFKINYWNAIWDENKWNKTKILGSEKERDETFDKIVTDVGFNVRTETN